MASDAPKPLAFAVSLVMSRPQRSRTRIAAHCANTKGLLSATSYFWRSGGFTNFKISPNRSLTSCRSVHRGAEGKMDKEIRFHHESRMTGRLSLGLANESLKNPKRYLAICQQSPHQRLSCKPSITETSFSIWNSLMEHISINRHLQVSVGFSPGE